MMLLILTSLFPILGMSKTLGLALKKCHKILITSFHQLHCCRGWDIEVHVYGLNNNGFSVAVVMFVFLVHSITVKDLKKLLFKAKTMAKL